MDEAHFKAIALRRVRASASRSRKPIVTAEYSLGSSGVRADLAILGSFFTGIEIKTGRDSLRRLETQLAAYERYFERTILIVAESHLRKLDNVALRGVELWSVSPLGKLEQLSSSETRTIRPEAYIDLLTKAERERLPTSLETADDLEGLLPAFRDAFARRYRSVSDAFWDGTSGRRIRPDDLQRLSRFADVRSEARRLEAAKAAKWANWMATNGLAA